MLCPHCGSGAAVPGRECPSCGQPQPGSHSIATGVLTPPSTTSEFETHLDSSGRQNAPASTGVLTSGAPFGRRYRILRPLGQGGMGVVYQAWDEELGLAVALKTIRPEVMSDPITAADVERRFKRELLLARQVTHRHVVRIHDLGEVEGVKYLTMPFIEGQTLASAIAQNGKLPIPRALQIVREIGDGLSAAHAAGVVHRDLKPENVMLEADGHAIIMDFGISRSLSGTGAGTAMGSVVGTLEYMSPEQARGEVADQRSDIYALGLIFYDMLAGRRRFATATNPMSEAMARMRQAPTPLRALEAAVPEPIETIVSRCLEPDPAKRYQNIDELLAELNRLTPDGHEPAARSTWKFVPRFAHTWPKAAQVALLTAVVLIVVSPAVLLGVLAGGWLRPPVETDLPRDPVSVLIANFENGTGDPVFEGSLEQALAIAMEGAPFVTSYSRTSAQGMLPRINEKTLNARAAQLIGLRESVNVVLAGGVAPRGSGYQLELRAINVADSKETAKVEASARSKSEVLAAVGELATAMREELGDTKADAGAETLTASTLDAVKNYSIAQDVAARGRFEEAIKYYEAAVKEDPKFGRAYSGLATSNFYLGRRDEAERNWNEALKYMDAMTEREKYRTRGTYFLAVTQDYDKAIDEYSTLVKLYPADRVGHNNLAFAYFARLNFPKALEEGRRAVDLAPNHVTIRNNYAMYALYASDFDTARKGAAEVIKLDPSFYKAYLVQAIAGLVHGDEAAARDAYATMAGKTDALGASVANLGLADIAMYKGEWSDAERLLKEGLESDRRAKNQDSVEAKSVALAEIRMALGDREGARAAALSALQTGTSERVTVTAGSLLAALQDEATVQKLAAGLKAQLQPQPRAYGHILEGDLALAERRFPAAVDAYRQAIGTADLWLPHLRLGIAYVEAGDFVAAGSELERCDKRRGEATSLFLDDLPTMRYLAPLAYWKARVHEGTMGRTAEAKAGYEAFLKLRPSSSDTLARDARARLTALR